jgi:glucan phosphorylase
MRQSNKQPITKDINKLTYPFSYKTNAIEILRLLKDNNLDLDSRCNSAKEYLWKKRQKDGYWKINSTYLPKCWIQFDKPTEKGLWISYEIEKLMA